MTSEHREDIMESLEEMIADFALDKGVKNFEHGSGTLSYGQVIDALTLAHREYGYSFIHCPVKQEFYLPELVEKGKEYDPPILLFSDKNTFLFPNYVTSSNFKIRNGESKQESIELETAELQIKIKHNLSDIEEQLADEIYKKSKCIDLSRSKPLLHSILQLSKEYLKNGREELNSKTKFNEDYNLYELPVKFIYEKSKKKIEKYS